MKKLFSWLFYFALVFALTFLGGLALTLYFQQYPFGNPLFGRVALVVLMGLLAGISIITVMKKVPLLIMFSAALFSVGFGLFLLDCLYPSQYGFKFFEGNLTNPVWMGFAQIGLGILFAGFFFLIRKKKSKVSRKRKTKTKSKSKRLKVKVRSNAQKRKGLKTASKRIISKKAITKSKPVGLQVGIRRFARRRKNVQLLGETEHRCPYCLELVKKNDPRGVMICPECKTWHHKDCWDVTGICQVAHRHDL